MYNKLIFGKDLQRDIVNVTVKDDKVFVYTETDGVVNQEIHDFKPWVLSHKRLESYSDVLKGDQYYKYLTEVSCAEYNELNKSYQKHLWMPRQIEETLLLFDGVTYYKGMKVEDVSILSFDIETNGLVMDESSKVFCISNTFRKKGNIIRRLFSIDEYNDQEQMIMAWAEWVMEVDPSIITGHNILSYDLPYLQNILHGHIILGRDGSSVEFAEKTSKFRKDGSQQYDYHNVRITGREIIDTFFLSIKYDLGRDFPSYGLKPIIKHLGLEKSDRTFIDASQIKNHWHDLAMRDRIKQYAIEDSDDALKLFDLMIPAYFYLAQSIPKTMQQMINEAAGSQLDALMIRSYLQDGYSQPRTSNKVPFEGAISMGIPGVYSHVCKADIASLYPSVMLEYNIHDNEKDPYNHMIQMLSYFRDERLRNKKLAKETGERYYDDMQNAQKICINSLYGFLGAGYLLYNYPKGAAEVTRRGREILLKGVEYATGHTLEKVVKAIANEGTENEEISYEYKVGASVSPGMGYKLVNVDTDSFSITKGIEVKPAEFAIFLESLNSLYNKLIRWEDDGIYEKVIVVRAKNYVLVRNGKVKFKGSAMTDQKKEPALIEMLEKMVYALLDDEKASLPTIYRSYIKEALNIQFINRWSTKKTITKSVLSPSRLTEQKVLDAVQETIDKGIVESVQEGDKIWVYNCIKGDIQVKAKGELVYFKDGRPKMKPNAVLRDVRLWEKDQDPLHYVSRVYSTVEILTNVLDMDKFEDYGKKSNAEKLKSLTS
jgi:DNA polymerase elongation subunit (family B)